MRRFASSLFALLSISLGISGMSGCGGGSSNSPAIPTPSKIVLNPANSSIDLGTTLQFSATVTNSIGGQVTVPVTFTSTNSAVLTFIPGTAGLACAGRWDTNGQICSPQG